MPAFIQKLFGGKKAPAPKPAEPTGPTANQQDKADRQDELRQQQLSRLSASPSQSELESLATQGTTADIRLSAAKLLTEKESLQRVQKQSKGKDKSVYQTVRQSLQALRAREEQQQQREQAIVTLIQNAMDQARSEDTKLYEPRLEALLKRWAELENHASESQANDFLQAVHDCRARLEVINAEKAMRAQALEQKNQRAETLALLAETLTGLKQSSPESEPSLASLDALQKTQENRWLEATRDTSVDKQEQKSYESLMLSLRAYISATRRFGQNREAILTLSDPDNASTDTPPLSAGDLIATVDWPAEFPMPPLLQKLARIAGKKPAQDRIKQPNGKGVEEQKALADKANNAMTELEQALEAKLLKESKQLFRNAQQQFKQLDLKHSQPLQARMQLLSGQLRELTDWQGFAIRPKQIALCEQMEYLADQPMEPEAKAERIKEIQNEWRGLGGSSDRELWARFKQASDLAYEPCKAYFSAKSGLKQANLETRKTIIDQLGAFIQNADWQSIDWKAAERIHQKAREEWKAAWPIEFRDNRNIQKEFDSLLKQLEEPLNEERKKNEALKQAIVEKAEALIDHEPLAEAMNQAKQLQGEWQRVGITRHREDRKLWQAFRNACDRIFARRDAVHNEQQEQARAADALAGGILETSRKLNESAKQGDIENTLGELGGLANEPLTNQIQSQVRQEQTRLRALIDSIRSREMVQAWQSHIRARVETPLNKSDLPAQWGNLAENLRETDAAELVIRAEILAEVPSSADDQARRMEIQVQRLANGIGGRGTDQSPTSQVEALVAAWCLRPKDDSVNESRAERLIAALEAVISQKD